MTVFRVAEHTIAQIALNQKVFQISQTAANPALRYRLYALLVTRKVRLSADLRYVEKSRRLNQFSERLFELKQLLQSRFLQKVSFLQVTGPYFL